MLRLVLAGSVVAVLLMTASPALAGTRQKILQECQDGRLSGDYTAKEIRDARDHIPTDIDQYSDCRDVRSRALAAKAGGGGSGGSGGGAGGAGGGTSGGGSGSGGGLLTPASPSDTNALTNAARAGGGPVDVGGSQIAPSLAADTSRNQLPTVVIVVLALLALAAGAGAAPQLRRLGGAAGLATIGRRVITRGR
jgi:hypothetical protein